MKVIRRMIAVSVVGCALSACSPSPDEQREPPPVKNSVANDATRALDKARGVEDTAMQHKEDLDRALQDAEGSH